MTQKKDKIEMEQEQFKNGNNAKGPSSSRHSIFDFSQMADGCLGTSVGQTGFIDGELWQMDTERNETHQSETNICFILFSTFVFLKLSFACEIYHTQRKIHKL